MSEFNFTSQIFINNNDPEEFRAYVKRYMPEFRKDKHKVNYNFQQKPNSLGVPYIVVYEAETGVVAGYMCYDIHKIGKKVVATTHCLSVRPDYRGKKLSERMIKELEAAICKEWPVEEIYEICNEISTKSYKACGFEETGSFRINKSGERCLIRLKKVIKNEK